MLICAPNNQKRGTYENGVFKRDNTPTQSVGSGEFIFLEPECIEQLRELGCKTFDWGIRGRKERLEIPLETFAIAPVVLVGGRRQHRFFLPQKK